MSRITDAITGLTNSRTSIKTAITNKGVEVPANAKFAQLASYIGQIKTGGSITPDPSIANTSYFYIRIPDLANTSTKNFKLYLRGSSKTINWGDATTSNSTATEWVEHTYSKSGDYKITVSGTSNFAYGGTNTTIGGVIGIPSDALWTVLKAVTIGTGTASPTNLNPYAFYNARSLEKVILPESGMTGIGDSAFFNCFSLQSITIPENITTIGGNAFYNSGLLEVHWKSSTPPTVLNANAFTGMTERTVFFVPQGSKSAYMQKANFPTNVVYIEEV